MLRFTNESLLSIINILKKEISNLNEHDILEFEVINCDNYAGYYNGMKIKIKDTDFIYRELKSWCDLADIFYCKFLTPLKVDDNFITVRYQKLQKDQSFHCKNLNIEEKYGNDSIFSKIDKNEDPAFLHYYLQALKNTNIDQRLKILNLGINDADEFEVIKTISNNFKNQTLIGIDYCKSAVEKAKERFKEDQNTTFYHCDINRLEHLNLGDFDLIISVGTFQSSSLNFKPLFMDIVQKYLKKEGAVILGFPNCRWIDGTPIFGARVKNYNFPEYSNLYNDVIFCKKYLQQKKYRVTVTGKNYIFLTATSIIH